jgi:hypothetical protein
VAEWTPFQTHYSENLVAPGIEPRNSDHYTAEAVRNPVIMRIKYVINTMRDGQKYGV